MQNTNEESRSFNAASHDRPVIAAIHNGLSALLRVKDAPYAKNIFQADKYIRDQRLFSKIRRLQISLENFDAANQGIGLIALVGHFSAGKSSAINAVLGLWGTPQERRNGKEPTDKKISVICLPRYRNQFRSLETLPGGEFTVQPVEHNLLNSICLVDTPGSADPELQAQDGALEEPKFDEETVRDFLPACDHIVYIFNGTNPFDTADIPALRMLLERLSFLPVTFVLTRANDYLLDPNKPVIENNIDNEVVRDVKITLQRRLGTMFGTAYSADDAILVDNKSGYGIDILTARLETIANSVANRDLREAKLTYYGGRAESLRKELLSIVEEKLDAWKTIWNDIEEKRKKWAEAVKGWQEVRNSWNLIRRQLEAKRAKYSEQNKPNAVAPQNWRSLPEFTRRLRDLEDAIKDSAVQEATRIAAAQVDLWRSQLLNHAVHLAKVSSNEPEKVDSWLSEVIKSLSTFENPDRLIHIGESLYLSYYKVLEGSIDAVKNFASDLSTRHKRVTTHLTQGQQADEIYKDIEIGFSTTRGTAIRFMHLVGQLAQAIIFARESTLFETLGISKSLFSAVSEFSEEEIEKFGTDVVNDLRKIPEGARDELRSGANRAYLSLSDNIPKGFSAPAFSTTLPDHRRGSSIDQIVGEIKPILDEWKKTEEQRITKFCKNIKEEYISKQLRMNELNNLWKAVKKKILKLTLAIGGGGFIFGAGVSLLILLEMAGMSASSGAYGILAGLVSTGVAGWFGNGFMKKKFGNDELFSRKISDTEAEFQRHIGAMMSTLTDDVAKLPVDSLSSKIKAGFVAHKDALLQAMGEGDVDATFRKLLEYDNAILSTEHMYKNILDSYSERLEGFSGDPDLIEKSLDQFSLNHWKKVLRPPLDVLEEVNRSLTETRDNLLHVTFSPYHPQ